MSARIQKVVSIYIPENLEKDIKRMVGLHKLDSETRTKIIKILTHKNTFYYYKYLSDSLKTIFEYWATLINRVATRDRAEYIKILKELETQLPMPFCTICKDLSRIYAPNFKLDPYKSIQKLAPSYDSIKDYCEELSAFTTCIITEHVNKIRADGINILQFKDMESIANFCIGIIIHSICNSSELDIDKSLSEVARNKQLSQKLLNKITSESLLAQMLEKYFNDSNVTPKNQEVLTNKPPIPNKPIIFSLDKNLSKTEQSTITSPNKMNDTQKQLDKKESHEEIKQDNESQILPLKQFTLSGHSESIPCASFSRDGMLAASGSFDKTVRVWDLNTGQCLITFVGHTDKVCVVALSKDNNLVLSGSIDNTVRIWNIKTRTNLRTLSGHTDAVITASFSENCELGISGSRDKTVRIWNLKTFECMKIFSDHTDFIWSVVFSQDGGLALSGSADKTARVWNTKTGECLRTLSGHTEEVMSVALNEDNNLVLSGSADKTVRVWNLNTGECLKILSGHKNRIWRLAFCQDGNFALSSSDIAIRIWNLKTWECEREFFLKDRSFCYSNLINADQLYVLAGDFKNILDFRHIGTLPKAKTYPQLQQTSRAISNQLDEKESYEEIMQKNETQILPLKPLTLSGHSERVSSVTISKNRLLALTGSNDKTILVWNLITGKYLITLSGHTDRICCTSLSQDNRLAISGSADNTIRVWNLKTGECIKILLGHTKGVNFVTLTQNEDLVVSGSADNTIRIWSVKTGECLKTLIGHKDSIWSVSLNKNEDLAVSGSMDNTVRVWDLKTGGCLRTLLGHSDIVTRAIFSQDNSLVLSSSCDKTIRIWDRNTGECLRILSGHTDRVFYVTLIPDGTLALTWARDNTLRFWNLNTGICEKEIILTEQIGQIFCLSVLFHTDQIYAILSDFEKNIIEFRNVGVLPKAKTYSQLQQASSAISKELDKQESSEEIKYNNETALAKTVTSKNEQDVSTMKASDLISQSTSFGSNKNKVQEDVKDKVDVINSSSNHQSSASKTEQTRITEVTPVEKRDKKEDHIINITTSFKVDYSTLTFGKKLGQGGFGSVFLGIWRHNDVAIKQLLLVDLSSDASKEFETEVQVMAKLHSPNIVSLYGYCMNPKYCIVMEYMPKGSLFNVLKSDQPLDWKIRIKMATDIACGLAFLHQEKILHRDIKSLNVLLDENMKAKLTDFGLSRIKNETRTTTAIQDSVGTINWMAPELFKRKAVYTQKSDIYSLGITIWELVSRKVPFSDAANPGLIPSWVAKGEREEIPEICPKKLSTLIQACWDGDADKRPDAEAVVTFLKSEGDDFQSFLPGYLASKNFSSFNQNILGNLNSNANPRNIIQVKEESQNSKINKTDSLFSGSILGNLSSTK